MAKHVPSIFVDRQDKADTAEEDVRDVIARENRINSSKKVLYQKTSIFHAPVFSANFEIASPCPVPNIRKTHRKSKDAPPHCTAFAREILQPLEMNSSRRGGHYCTTTAQSASPPVRSATHLINTRAAAATGLSLPCLKINSLSFELLRIFGPSLRARFKREDPKTPSILRTGWRVYRTTCLSYCDACYSPRFSRRRCWEIVNLKILLRHRTNMIRPRIRDISWENKSTWSGSRISWR